MYLLSDTHAEPLVEDVADEGSRGPASIRAAAPKYAVRTRFGTAEANRLLEEKMAPWIQELRLVVDACSSAGATLRLPTNARVPRAGDILCGPALMACAD